MNHTQLKSAVHHLLELREHYTSGRASSEGALDFPFYSYLEARFGSMSRQYHIHIAGRQRAQRIDYRQGTSNPTLIEFAVRPPSGGTQLYGYGNDSELRKLCRIPPSKAKRRILLLLDLSHHPIPRAKLKRTYDAVHSGRGGAFRRRTVSVIYFHHDLQYTIHWSR
jgi:hypothetical protein